MDLNKKVIVLTPNGRRQNIKINSSTTLLQVLEEASAKHGFPSDNYGLKSHNKELDLMQMFRFSGLPNNCLLEMFECAKKRVESLADICIQVENGSRFQGRFSPSTCLWDVLKKLCPEQIEPQMSPVVIYMRVEIYGEKLRQTTLKSLGITGGRTLMHLVNKNPEEIKTQAGVYVPPEIKEEPKEEKLKDVKVIKKQPKTGGFSITSELVQSLKKTENIEDAVPEDKEDELMNVEEPDPKQQPPKVKYDWGTGPGRSMNSSQSSSAVEEQEIQTDEMEVEPEYNVIGDRNAVLYSLDAINMQVEDLPDSFYELTVDDLKLVLKDLKKIASGNDLISRLNANAQREHYNQCVIRIQFPDRHVLQGIFKPTDKIADVMCFVRKFLVNDDLDFHLFTIPPKKLLSHDLTLLEVNCVPNGVLHFGVKETDVLPSIISYLKRNYLTQLTSVEGAYFLAFKATRLDVHVDDIKNIINDSPGPSTGAIPKRPRSDNNFAQPSSSKQNPNAVPKWFKTKN